MFAVQRSCPSRQLASTFQAAPTCRLLLKAQEAFPAFAPPLSMTVCKRLACPGPEHPFTSLAQVPTKGSAACAAEPKSARSVLSSQRSSAASPLASLNERKARLDKVPQTPVG